MVVGLHLGLGLWLGRQVSQMEPHRDTAPVIRVDLVPPVVIPPEAPPEAPSRSEGGGAPASTSAVRPPLTPPVKTPPELVAPPVVAPEPPLVIGVAEESTPTPGQGQGGIGTGTGRGQGSGSGDGSGSGPRFLSGPTQDQLRSLHPREAFRRRQGGRVQLSCQVALDGRLNQCRVLEETPKDLGFGPAALAAAQYFRFRPASRAGQAVDGANIVVGVQWP